MGTWSRDGRSIYFVSNRTKNWEIWKMPADGGEAVQVTRNGGYVSFESVDGTYLYFSKRLEEGKLWRVPVAGGEETPVLDAVEGISFAIFDKGIYFIQPPEGASSPTLRSLSFETGKVELIAALPNLARYQGLSVSPNGRYVLYTQQDQAPGSDLMLVENFK
jgi:dipeptidyl aminopeptidase/acylaminoacyl peptidase